MEGLRSSEAFVRKELGHRIRLRRSPEITFVEDNSLERGDRMVHLLNELSRNKKQTEEIVDS